MAQLIQFTLYLGPTVQTEMSLATAGIHCGLLHVCFMSHHALLRNRWMEWNWLWNGSYTCYVAVCFAVLWQFLEPTSLLFSAIILIGFLHLHLVFHLSLLYLSSHLSRYLWLLYCFIPGSELILPQSFPS